MGTFGQQCARLAVALCMAIAFQALAQEADSGQSLADVARKLRKDTSDEVKMTPADTERLFKSVDTILEFAAEDSGMPKHADVKKRMVSKTQTTNQPPNTAASVVKGNKGVASTITCRRASPR